MSAQPSERRLARRFARLAAEGRAGLVTFVSAGDPDIDTSLALLKRLPGAGADIVELGMVFSDPMADGPAIQAAGKRALKAGITLKKTLDMVRAFRAADAETPLVLMGYYNPIYVYGNERFVRDARAAGADGVIVVDLPPEEDAELRPLATAQGLDFIRLATPTSDDARLPVILTGASGFIYYVSILGITGTRSAGADVVAGAVARLRRLTQLPIAVGFGIRTAPQAGAIAAVADAAVVGSALVERIAANLDADGRALPALVDDVTGFVSALAKAVRDARLPSRAAGVAE